MPPEIEDVPEYADLTDAEREAMNIDETTLSDDDAPTTPAETAPAGEVAPAADADPAAVPADGDPAADPADDAAAAAPEAAPAVADPAPAAEPAAAPAPAADPVSTQQFLVIPPPADAAEKLAQIAADKAAAASAFDNGETTAAEFQAKLDSLNEAKLQIDLAVNNANLSAQMERNRAQMAWDAQCDAFFKDPAASIYTDPANFAVFNDMVKAMAPMPRNRGLSERQLLEKVDQMTRAELGLPARTAAQAPTAPAAKKPVAPKPVPPSLGNLPSADPTDATGGQFAHLDRMAVTDPLGYEAKLASMSEAQRDAYFKA